MTRRSLVSFFSLTFIVCSQDAQYEPSHDKTCLQGFRLGPVQTELYSQEACNFGFWKKMNYTTIKSRTRSKFGVRCT